MCYAHTDRGFLFRGRCFFGGVAPGPPRPFEKGRRKLSKKRKEKRSVVRSHSIPGNILRRKACRRSFCRRPARWLFVQTVRSLRRGAGGCKQPQWAARGRKIRTVSDCVACAFPSGRPPNIPGTPFSRAPARGAPTKGLATYPVLKSGTASVLHLNKCFSVEIPFPAN